MAVALRSLLFFCILSLPCLADPLDLLYQYAPSLQTPHALPFEAQAQLKDNEVRFDFVLQEGSYLYKKAFKLEGSQAQLGMLQLPEATSYQDFSGQVEVYFDHVTISAQVLHSQADSNVTLHYQGCDAQGICYPPQQISLKLPLIQADYTSFAEQQNVEQGHLFAGKSLILSLIFAFILGMGLDLTPCVLPMLSIYASMLVGTKQPTTTKLIWLNLNYLCGLGLTYTAIGLVFSQLGMSAQAILMHPLSVICMSLLLILFSLDSFGLISLSVPRFFLQKTSSFLGKQHYGTAGAALIFGMLCAILSTPCTSAPLAGAIIYITTQGSVVYGGLLFLAIGLGMGTPLVLIGMFGKKILPKPGTISVLIKQLMGILLIVTAIYLSEHLLRELADNLPLYLYLLCLSATLFLVLHFYKIKAIAVYSSLAVLLVLGCAGIKYWIAEDQAAIFTKLKKLEDLNSYLGQPIILSFSAQWCHNCHALDAQIYSQQQFLTKTHNYTLLRFDLSDVSTPSNQAIIEHFKLIGVPQMLILDPAGQVLTGMTGMASEAQILQLVDKYTP